MILTALALAALTQLPPNHPQVLAKPQIVDGGALPPNHPVVPTGTPNNEELLKQLDGAGAELKNKDKPFEVALAMGKLYASSARRPEAIDLLRQAQAKANPARATYLELRKKAFAQKTPPAGQCTESPASLEDAHKRAKELAKKDLALALSCLKNAMQPVLEGDSMLANTLFLTGDKVAALQTYGRVLEISDTHEDALYGEAVILVETNGEDVKSLEKAKNNFDRYVQIYPAGMRVDRARAMSARTQAAINAGGMSKVGSSPQKQPVAQNNDQPPPLTREQMMAAESIKVDAEGEKALQGIVEEAEALLVKSDFQGALDKYKQVMIQMPRNARAQAGMAWSLIGLNRQPMADRVWGVAVSSDPTAVEALGDMLKAKGDAAGAKKLWTKLKETRPEMAARLDPKIK